MTDYSVEEKVQIIKWLYSGVTTEEIPTRFATAFDNRPAPTPEVIGNIVENFEASGCVTDCRKCDSDDINDTKKIKRPKADKGSDSIDSDEPSSSSKEKPKLPKVQEIPPEDKIKRLEFCDDMLKRMDKNEDFVKNILFTGESVFSIGIHHTPAEIRYWAKTHTPMNVPTEPQNSQKIEVWVGILNDVIIGPFFTDGHLNSGKYLHLFQKDILPSIKSLDVNFKDIWLQHDGLPAHNARSIKLFLKSTFSKRVIGFNGTVIWPPRSSDLSPVGFFIWGYIKQKVYSNFPERPKDIEELKTKIKETIESITPAMLADVRQEFINRIGKCKEQNGGEVTLSN